MRLVLSCVVFVVGAGCAPANYFYSFDLTNAGAHNVAKPGERDVLDDNDVKSEILVDPTSFQAVLLDLTNKTEAPIQIGWDQISIVRPDHTQQPLRPDAPMPPSVEPGAQLMARLVQFALPPSGAAARVYDNSDFELVVPMVVRGTPTERRYALHVHLTKL
jgi:hypothetical protein